MCFFVFVKLLGLLVGAVVLLVDVAGAVRAVHGRALRAAVVLLLLHAAGDVLLLARAAANEALLVALGARVAVIPGALLVGLGQGVVAARAGVLRIIYVIYIYISRYIYIYI